MVPISVIRWEQSKRCRHYLRQSQRKKQSFSRFKSREKISKKGGFSIRTGLTKKQKVTEVYYNAKDPTAEVYTHDTKLKKRLLEYASKFPELCQQTDDDEQGGLRFEIDKSRISIRLTTPYSNNRKAKLAASAKVENLR